MSDTAKWYVVHTYSGYENKVATSIENAVENRKLHDLIQEIRVPTETVVEIKDDKKREVERKLFPSYVLVKMIMTDDSWYVVRNIRGVTGFVGPGSKPVPLTDEEVARLGVDTGKVEVNFAVGDSVNVVSGYLDGFIGTVEALDPEKNYVRVVVSMMGKDVPRAGTRSGPRTGLISFEVADPRPRCTGRLIRKGSRVLPVGGEPLFTLCFSPKFTTYLMEVQHNGTESSRLHQASDPGRKGNSCTAGRPRSGSAWR